MLKDLFVWLLVNTLARVAPKETPSAPLLELNAHQAAENVALEEKAQGLEDDYATLKAEYVHLAQRIEVEGQYLEPTEESLCLKLYELLKEQKILPVTANDISRAVEIDRFNAQQDVPGQSKDDAEKFFVDKKTGKKVRRVDFVYVATDTKSATATARKTGSQRF